MLDFRIHTFLAVCRHMNFTRAAEELHITQPGVSRHIHQLEEGVTFLYQAAVRCELTSGRLREIELEDFPYPDAGNPKKIVPAGKFRAADSFYQ